MTTAVLNELDVAPPRPDWHDRSLCGPFFAETGFDAWHGPDEDELEKAADEVYVTFDVKDMTPDEAAITAKREVLRVRAELREQYRGVARKICRECPVRRECLQWAMEHENPGHRAGIWGGLTETQRSHLATKSAAKQAA